MEPDSPMPEQNAALGGKGKPVTNSAVKGRKAEGANRLVLPSGLGARDQGVQTALANSGGQTISALSRLWLRWSIYPDFAQQFPIKVYFGKSPKCADAEFDECNSETMRCCHGLQAGLSSNLCRCFRNRKTTCEIMRSYEVWQRIL